MTMKAAVTSEDKCGSNEIKQDQTTSVTLETSSSGQRKDREDDPEDQFDL